MTELLSCPFCGRSDVDRNSDKWGHWIFCSGCEARGAYGHSPAEAAMNWNTRAPAHRSGDLPSEVRSREAAVRAVQLSYARNDLEPTSEATLALYRKDAEHAADAVLATLDPAQVAPVLTLLPPSNLPMENDPDVLQVARAIAERGIGRYWDDFPETDAFDTDQGDLIEYARAAVEIFRRSAPQPPIVAQASVGCGDVPERETWWLIERPGPVYTSSRGRHPNWDTDSWRAERFATAKEADDARLQIVANKFRDESTVVEHMFINKQPRALSVPSADREGNHG